MNAIKHHPGIFLLAMLLSLGAMAVTARAAPPPDPVAIPDGEPATPAEDNMDWVVGEELC